MSKAPWTDPIRRGCVCLVYGLVGHGGVVVGHLTTTNSVPPAHPPWPLLTPSPSFLTARQVVAKTLVQQKQSKDYNAKVAAYNAKLAEDRKKNRGANKKGVRLR